MIKDEKTVVGWESPIAIHPGEFLRDALECFLITQIELARRTGMSKKVINDIVNGNNPITRATAYKLSKVFPFSADYWVNLQKEYEDNKARLEERQKIETEINKFIFSFKETYNELVKNKIIKKFVWTKINYAKIILELQKYFAVDSLGFIEGVNLAAAFRKYKRNNINHYSLAAWLRFGQLQAIKTESREFDEQKLISSLSKIKSLSILPPEIYIPEIKKILLEAGVVLVCAPYFRNTHAQGATQWIRDDKAYIILKTTKQGEDKFWFNLFHEIGHILKHKKKDVFINIDDGDNNDILQENEADNFAQKQLIPDYNALIKKYTEYRRAIISIAEYYKISRSIVAGRLAHENQGNRTAWILTNKFIRKIHYVDVFDQNE